MRTSEFVVLVVVVVIMTWFSKLILDANETMDTGRYSCATVQLGSRYVVSHYARVCTAIIHQERPYGN